jgi:hypothetical protein
MFPAQGGMHTKQIFELDSLTLNIYHILGQIYTENGAFLSGKNALGSDLALPALAPCAMQQQIISFL